MILSRKYLAYAAILSLIEIQLGGIGMGIFDFFKGIDINGGVEEFRGIKGAILLDVRTPQEYREGHIPESRNVPLQEIDKVDKVVQNKDVPVYVYCRSGARSRQASDALLKMGYRQVKDLGGIISYKGKVVR